MKTTYIKSGNLKYLPNVSAIIDAFKKGGSVTLVTEVVVMGNQPCLNFTASPTSSPTFTLMVMDVNGKIENVADMEFSEQKYLVILENDSEDEK